MARTTYVLTHRLTGKKLPLPWIFPSMSEGMIYALEHNLLADVVPASGDLFGVLLPSGE